MNENLITAEQAAKIADLAEKVCNKQDAWARFSHGHTNFTAEEIKAQHGTAIDNFLGYLKSITEKEANMATNYGAVAENTSFTLKASIQTYEVNLPELKKLFARELGVPASRILIDQKTRQGPGDPMDRFDAPTYFDGLTITVKNT